MATSVCAFVYTCELNWNYAFPSFLLLRRQHRWLTLMTITNWYETQIRSVYIPCFAGWLPLPVLKSIPPTLNSLNVYEHSWCVLVALGGHGKGSEKEG